MYRDVLSTARAIGLEKLEVKWPEYLRGDFWDEGYKVPTLPRIITEYPILREAIVYFIKNSVVELSHGFHHVYGVAEQAVKKAGELGYDEEDLVHLTLMAFFHDMFRTSQEITDRDGFERSVAALRDFCLGHSVPQSSIDVIVVALTEKEPDDSRARRLQAIFEYADFVEYLDRKRIFSAIYENNTMRHMPIQASKEVYLEKLQEKYERLCADGKKYVGEFIGLRTLTAPIHDINSIVGYASGLFPSRETDLASKITEYEMLPISWYLNLGNVHSMGQIAEALYEAGYKDDAKIIDGYSAIFEEGTKNVPMYLIDSNREDFDTLVKDYIRMRAEPLEKLRYLRLI